MSTDAYIYIYIYTHTHTHTYAHVHCMRASTYDAHRFAFPSDVHPKLVVEDASGLLSFTEMSAILREGNPSLTDKDP